MGARHTFRMTSPGSVGEATRAGKERRMLSVATDAQAQDELRMDLDELVRAADAGRPLGGRG
jgi:hypothetical protein